MGKYMLSSRHTRASFDRMCSLAACTLTRFGSPYVTTARRVMARGRAILSPVPFSDGVRSVPAPYTVSLTQSPIASTYPSKDPSTALTSSENPSAATPDMHPSPSPSLHPRKVYTGVTLLIVPSTDVLEALANVDARLKTLCLRMETRLVEQLSLPSRSLPIELPKPSLPSRVWPRDAVDGSCLFRERSLEMQ